MGRPFRESDFAAPAAPEQARKPRSAGGKGKRLERIALAPYCGAVIVQVPQAARVVRGKGKEPFTIRQKGPCDFFGTFRSGGRSLVFDAKEDAGKHRLKTTASHLPEHQRLALVEHGRAGAFAGLLCLSTSTDHLFWCDWTLLVERRPSIRWDDMVFVGGASSGVHWHLLTAKRDQWLRERLPLSPAAPAGEARP